MSSASGTEARIRVLRIFHAGRNPAHRARDRALVAAGVDVVYVVPREWPEAGGESDLTGEAFPVVEVEVRRPGDVNRHSYADPDAVAALAGAHGVDLVDLLEEPFSRVAGQLLPRLPARLPVVMYSAQNLDKRWPPPFSNYERRSFERVQAFYPCSRQAASVLRGKGFDGLIEPLPLGYDDGLYTPGRQSLAAGPYRLTLVGRMVAHKGVADAVRVLAGLRRRHGVDAVLVLAGSGPDLPGALRLAEELGLGGYVEHRPWLAAADLGELYRHTHVVLTPSRSTATWVEQFGRMIVEAQASGCVVAGYDSGSIAEVGGPPALLVGEGDVDALTAATAGLLGDEDDYRRRRDAGLAQSAGRTWSAVAARQADLYRTVLGRPSVPRFAASPRRRRQLACAEFGPPATALGQARPFALPGLRQPNVVTSALGQALDWPAEIRSRWASRGRGRLPG